MLNNLSINILKKLIQYFFSLCSCYSPLWVCNVVISLMTDANFNYNLNLIIYPNVWDTLKSTASTANQSATTKLLKAGSLCFAHVNKRYSRNNFHPFLCFTVEL